jgi:hypothetical protein
VARILRPPGFGRGAVDRQVGSSELPAETLRSGAGMRDRAIYVTRKGQRVVARAEAGWTDAQNKARALLGERGVRGLEVVSDVSPR